MKKIDLNKLPLEQALKELEKVKDKIDKATIVKKGVWQLGKNYVIRTVTMIQIGRLVEVTDNELVLEDASWIPDTGRWTNFLAEGKLNEVEPFPKGKVIVGRHSLIDSTLWLHNLPSKQK